MQFPRNALLCDSSDDNVSIQKRTKWQTLESIIDHPSQSKNACYYHYHDQTQENDGCLVSLLMLWALMERWYPIHSPTILASKQDRSRDRDEWSPWFLLCHAEYPYRSRTHLDWDDWDSQFRETILLWHHALKEEEKNLTHTQERKMDFWVREPAIINLYSEECTNLSF